MYRVVASPESDAGLYSVMDADDNVLADLQPFLRYLTFVGRSPNTVRAYAYDLRDYFHFLSTRGLDWRTTQLEQVADFVASLRPVQRDGRLTLVGDRRRVTDRTVNRKLAALASFYDFQCSRQAVAQHPLALIPGGGRTGSYRSFLHHANHGKPVMRRPIVLREERKRPPVLTAAEVQAILDACRNLRDRLLFAILTDTGLRLGEALGLQHDDIDMTSSHLQVVRRRESSNHARAKSGGRMVPFSNDLFRLYADYLEFEEGASASEYVFVNLWREPLGTQLSASGVYDLVRRITAKSGVSFNPHMFRHTYATDLLRRGVTPEIVQALLGHKSVTTTTSTYSHISCEDSRAALQAVGYFSNKQVRLCP